MRPSRTVVASGLAAVMAVAGCTVPTNEDPVELSGTVPYGLLETTTTTTSSVPDAVTKVVSVYFLESSDGSSNLVAVPRDVDVGAGVQEILSNLFTVRPDGAERPDERGLSSAIPESATLLSASVVPGTATLVVDVRGLFGNEGIQGTPLRNALAQIVWTATELAEVSEVAFRNNGSPVQALIDDGEIAEGTVNRNDYDRTR